MKWFYRGGRPNWLAGVLNRLSASLFSLGIAPNYLVAMEVRGRRSGRTIRLPMVMAVVGSERYLVSMLGPEVSWVQNARAAAWNVRLCHGRLENVHLEEVPPDKRAPVLKTYLQRAPGARPHVPVNKDAPLSEFEKVAPRIPVFRVVSSNQKV